MRTFIRIHPKKIPMIRKILLLCMVLPAFAANSQTSITAINVIGATGADSAPPILTFVVIQMQGNRIKN